MKQKISKVVDRTFGRLEEKLIDSDDGHVSGLAEAHDQGLFDKGREALSVFFPLIVGIVLFLAAYVWYAVLHRQ